MQFFSTACLLASIVSAAPVENTTNSQPESTHSIPQISAARVQFLRSDHTKVETSGPVGGCFGIQGNGHTKLNQILELTPGAAIFYYSDFNCVRNTRLNENNPQSYVGETPVYDKDVRSIRIIQKK